MKKGQLAHLARPGTTLTLRVTLGAAHNGIEKAGGMLHVRVTAVAAGGKANKAVLALLANALGVARSQLTLVRGAKGRDKVVRVG